jgi:hypothetical protein
MVPLVAQALGGSRRMTPEELVLVDFLEREIGLETLSRRGRNSIDPNQPLAAKPTYQS